MIEPGDRVCVTGAAGFIGSHLCAALLRGGYRVRGTVLDETQARDDTRRLREIAAETGSELEFVTADLTRPGAFDNAVADCPFVCHLASAVRLRAPDPQREIVDVAVNGTLNVLGAVDRAGLARRVVMTSSVAAVVDTTRPPQHIFDESDWNESASLESDPYALSKVLAERAAWDHVRARANGSSYDFVTLHPSLVQGPLMAEPHVRATPFMLHDLFTNKARGVADFRYSIIDVRDVAAAVVRALQRPDATGRHLLANRQVSLGQVADWLQQAVPDRRVPRLRIPNAVMLARALVDRNLSREFLRQHLSVVRRLDTHKARRALGMTFRSPQTTICDTARSFLEFGLI